MKNNHPSLDISPFLRYYGAMVEQGSRDLPGGKGNEWEELVGEGIDGGDFVVLNSGNPLPSNTSKSL